MASFLVVPVTEAPSQQITITLNGQAVIINLYTKSITIPVLSPNQIPTEPPQYQNTNPCFVDVYTASGANLVIGGVYVRQGALIVRDTYLGFVGDLSVIDTSGAGEDPQGVPPVLPPQDLRNPQQTAEFPLSDGDLAPPNVSGLIPGMGTRWLLTYWAPGTYVPGYSLPRG